MFLAKHSPLIGYHGNNEWPISKLLILKNGLYNCLKTHKVWGRSAKPFLKYLAKTLRGILPRPWPPSPNRVTSLHPLQNNCRITCNMDHYQQCESNVWWFCLLRYEDSPNFASHELRDIFFFPFLFLHLFFISFNLEMSCSFSNGTLCCWKRASTPCIVYREDVQYWWGYAVLARHTFSIGEDVQY